MSSTKFELLDFQTKAARDALQILKENEGKTACFERGVAGGWPPPSLTGQKKPVVVRIKAITGAGKTPILATIAAGLKDAIILWTTPWGAIVDQTTRNLQSSDRYATLLPPDYSAINIEQALQGATWRGIVEATSGTTIITATVQSFNQDGENLNIHKGGENSPWNQLMNERRRQLWVFYDESHDASERQLAKLVELKPRGLVLASAGDLPPEVLSLLPGEGEEAKKETLRDFTVNVETKDVAQAGLIKTAIEVHDLNTAPSEILSAAIRKREHLEQESGKPLIACIIVDNTKDGIDVWHQMVTKCGVPPSIIAVHLNRAVEVAAANKALGFPKEAMVVTYPGLNTEQLRQRQFRFLIWNLSLQQGWDEPLAFVGYFHGEQRNRDQAIQRIGRLLRNPFRDENGMPLLHANPELRTAYCYLNAQDDILEEVVDGLKKELLISDDTVEVSIIRNESEDRPHETVMPKEARQLVPYRLNAPGSKIADLLLKKLKKLKLDGEEATAPGRELTIKLAIENGQSESALRSLDENVPTTVGVMLRGQIEQLDWRIVRSRGSEGGWMLASIWSEPVMQCPVAYGSQLQTTLAELAKEFVEEVLGMVNRVEEPYDPYFVGPISLINPNNDNEAKAEYYKVRSFKNSLHRSYNALNGDELKIARAIDGLGLTWVRNPARSGYGIPLIHPEGKSFNFFPDFIVWLESGSPVFVEGKGAHILEGAIKSKLKSLADGKVVMLTREPKTENWTSTFIHDDRVRSESGTLEALIKTAVQS